MGWFNDYSNDYDQVHNQGNITHDLLAGAVTYEAAKAYEDHCADNGRPDNHAKAKELFAGFAGAAAMRLGETKGRDVWDNYQQNRVQQQAQDAFDSQYSQTYTDQTYSNQTYSDQTYSDQTYSDQTYTRRDQGSYDSSY